jgi:phosphoribosylformylglycinamidine synthase
VEATAIGQFTDTKQLVLKYGETKVGEVSMHFLHDGRPPVIREAVYEIKESQLAQGAESSKADYTDDLKKILGSLNVASKEWIIRQYDHEVQAGSVVKPLVGIHNDGPSDAAVVRPDLNSSRGLVVSCGINPHFGDQDPYWMAASAIDEAVRNCVAVGADPNRIAILDNFCWGNTERPETLGTLVRAAVGCQDMAVAYGTPFVSGKDSLNNEFSYEDGSGTRRTVAIPSTLLITALGQVDDVETCVTMDLKGPGNLLYLIGETKDEMGGSHYNLVNGISGGKVPTVNKEGAPKTFRALHQAIKQGLVLSCHDLSEGGLAVAAAEMAFAGGVGIQIDLKAGSIVPLFSESNTRFLVEVAVSSEGAFSELLAGVTLEKLGMTSTGEELVITSSGRQLVRASLKDLKACWQKPLA